MKTRSIIVLSFALVFLLSFCTSQTPEPMTETEESTAKTSAEDLVKRGEYLVTVSGCNDCHSPKIMTDKGPEPDPARLLSGHPADEALPAITDAKMIAPGQWALFNPNLTAAVGPWGTTFAANLTSDDSGIGLWTFDQFKKAMREGISKGVEGNRPILPPMPWPNVAAMTDEDLEAVFAYLKSLPPVKNVVPQPVPPMAG